MSSSQLTVLTALLLAVQTVPQLDGQWSSVRTSAFEAVGDVEQSRIIAASVFFEHVLQATRLVIPSVKGPAASPITVIVTEDSRLISERFVEGRYRSYAMVDARQSKMDASTVSSVVRQLIRNSAESLRCGLKWASASSSARQTSTRTDLASRSETQSRRIWLPFANGCCRWRSSCLQHSSRQSTWIR